MGDHEFSRIRSGWKYKASVEQGLSRDQGNISDARANSHNCTKVDWHYTAEPLLLDTCTVGQGRHVGHAKLHITTFEHIWSGKLSSCDNKKRHHRNNHELPKMKHLRRPKLPRRNAYAIRQSRNQVGLFEEDIRNVRICFPMCLKQKKYNDKKALCQKYCIQWTAYFRRRFRLSRTLNTIPDIMRTHAHTKALNQVKLH